MHADDGMALGRLEHPRIPLTRPGSRTLSPLRVGLTRPRLERMSNLEPHPTAAVSGGTADVAAGPVVELLEDRDVVLGGTRGMPVSRTLPNKERRMVGAWCFV